MKESVLATKDGQESACHKVAVFAMEEVELVMGQVTILVA